MLRISLPGCALLLSLSACGDDEYLTVVIPRIFKALPGLAPTPPHTPQQQALVGGPFPTLLLSQALHAVGPDGRPTSGLARLEVWRDGPAGWSFTRLEDPDSSVFHKAILLDDGSILTIGGMGATLKRWKHARGAWAQDTIWQESWGGRIDGLSDIEIGDVDGDGMDEYIIATHDYGVIAVYSPDRDRSRVEIVELDKKGDTLVHEIEIGDIDGDGRLEFFASLSERSPTSQEQRGEVVMYRWDGTTFIRTVVDSGRESHPKEILVADIDGDGQSELFSVQEAVIDTNDAVLQTVTIRQYRRELVGGFSFDEIAQIDDRQTRFLIAEDFDGDGTKELIAAATQSGLYRISPEAGAWTVRQFDANSSSFEHPMTAADLDGDGRRELYVAADNQRELKRYDWDADKGTLIKTLLGRLEPGVTTWNIEAGRL